MPLLGGGLLDDLDGTVLSDDLIGHLLWDLDVVGAVEGLILDPLVEGCYGFLFGVLLHIPFSFSCLKMYFYKKMYLF